ncbi:hypothetical protein M9H77_30675 [Catharanthus roseus]|uniref:Uncharacterized protein n=1 Tax=Catharanthus roseus TaxID=4058 RepID=A0ACB9ZXW6_CATRO|nr:hypothetical protein M9H77_30675 [Catharanthus roseus]
MSSPLSRQKEARKTCAQKKVRFEKWLREVGVVSNEDLGKKTSIGEPSGPWSKKSENEESARSQEVMLDKNDICERKESHERRERVEESEGFSNFQDKRKRIGGKLHHNHKETSISFSSDSLPLSLEFSFEEYKLFLNPHSSQSYTFLKYPLMLGDATRDHSCDSSLYDSRIKDYYSYVANVDSFILGVENKKERMLEESIVVLESENKWGDSWGFTVEDILEGDDPYNLSSTLLKENGSRHLKVGIGGGLLTLVDFFPRERLEAFYWKKALGPNGFHVVFYQKCWSVVGPNVIKLCFPSGISSTFFAYCTIESLQLFKAESVQTPFAHCTIESLQLFKAPPWNKLLDLESLQVFNTIEL